MVGYERMVGILPVVLLALSYVSVFLSLTGSNVVYRTVLRESGTLLCMYHDLRDLFPIPGLLLLATRLIVSILHSINNTILQQ